MFADGNAWADGTGPPGPAELLHLVAYRPATGERFESVLRPRRPLAPYVRGRLGLSPDALEDGEAITSVGARWRRFSGEDDVVCTAQGVEVLTESIPKSLADMESLAGTA